MDPSLTLNTLEAHTWAQVSQLVMWDDYALSSGGQVTVKATRSSVIVLGRGNGEGEDVRCLQAPTPSSFGVAVGRVNIQAHALAFARAGHGKVRPSVRWKTNFTHRRYISRIAFARIAIVARYIRTGWWTLHHWPSLKKYLKRTRDGIEIIAYLQCDERENAVSDFIDHLVSSKGFNSVDDYSEREISEEWWEAIEGSLPNYNFHNEIKKYGSSFLQFLSNIRDKFNLQAAFQAYVEIRRERIASIAKAVYINRVERLEALKRYVKRYERRTRVPRPLYARPRPPTCPIAPPLA